MNTNTITLAELAALKCSTFTVKDDSPRGCCTKMAREVKPGDRVCLDNHFVEVTEDAAPAETKTPADIIEAAASAIEDKPARSAWARGVKAYALELLDKLADPAAVRAALLNGAEDWQEYSDGGCSLIYDPDIAARVCTPSELKRTHNGERYPNSREIWLDVQARALSQAARLVCEAVKEVIA